MLDTKLQNALDEVVKEIKSMDPSVLKQELEKSSKSVFAQTIDELNYNGEE